MRTNFLETNVPLKLFNSRFISQRTPKFTNFPFNQIKRILRNIYLQNKKLQMVITLSMMMPQTLNCA